jgi:hypothetical protein
LRTGDNPVTSKLANPALFLPLTVLLFGASAAWAENEPVATAPVPQAPAASGPMTPVQKEAPVATAPKPSIAMPAETRTAKPPPKAETLHETAAPTPAAKGTPERKEATPVSPAAENPATPPAKTAARPKRPVQRRVPERENAMRSDQPVAPSYYGTPSQQPYQRGYDETWRESEGPGYRTPAPYYGPAPYQREEMKVWRSEPAPYNYPPPSYYRDMPPRYAPYPGAPPPPWGW